MKELPFDLTKEKHHPVSEQIVQLLRTANQNVHSDTYFRVLAAFYIAQVASTMRTQVESIAHGSVPVNVYAFAMAPSGFGKTKSMHILERDILGSFYKSFKEVTLPSVSEQSFKMEAARQANRNGTDYDSELDKLNAEYESYGAFVFDFPEGSGPAFRQVRGKTQMAGIGSTNLIIDEMGYNLSKNAECLDVHFECYDIGVIKDKITKSSAENKRWRVRTDAVPSNLLAFGTPEKCFDGSTTEKEILQRFEAGFARRFIFGYGEKACAGELSAEELYDQLISASTNVDVSDLRSLFNALADEMNHNRVIKVERNEGVELTAYKQWCEKRADAFAPHETIRIAEMAHRYFRAMKIAGAYAFIDSSPIVRHDHLMAAIKLCEESGNAFERIMARPKAHVRLAQYLSKVEEEQTHADIMEALAFYPESKQKQENLWALAIAWGHKNNCIIKRRMFDGIEFFKGESLKEVDLENIRFSYSDQLAHGYKPVEASYQKLKELCQTRGYNFSNHHFIDSHRCDDNVIMGCDFILLDCDGEVSLKEFAACMDGFECYIYTTKRHTSAVNRFRVILPLKYRVHLTKEDYREFVTNIYDSLPYQVSDDGGNQRSKKWACHQGGEASLYGELFDPIPYLPHTKKNADRIAEEKSLKDMNKVQKFFAKQWSNGSGRNNVCLRYGTMLLDTGGDLQDVLDAVRAFNKSFSDPLDEDELNTTVFLTLGKKAAKK